ncbi:hypothetical protein JCM1840_000528 [Sporobolomyces johnsonii]
MLDRLPNELVLRIIELSVPSTLFSTTYSSRQTNLRNCCLVSRQFRQLAQPLLFAFFQATSREELHSFLSATKAIGLEHHVQAVLLAYPSGVLRETVTVSNDLVRLAHDCPALQQLSIPDLRSLTLNNADMFASRPFVLPLLADLSSYPISATPEMLTSTFTPSTLPSLRALAICPVNDDASFIESIETLCSQLHMLSMHGMDWAYLPDGAFTSSRPFTLLDCDLGEFATYWDKIKMTHHLRLCSDDPSSEATDTQRHLTDVTSRLLNTTQIPLRTIYLSPHLHPYTSLPVALAQARDDFLAACVTRGIEVCWEEIGEWELDSAISPSFWRKARAIKASASG